jgi:tRNA G18 (ribose-2'-O)-methylase SpoU
MDSETDSRNVIDRYKGLPVETIAEEMRTRAFRVHIAIENLQHDFNIGSIVRSANAFNVASVSIVGRRHWNRRGAMSTEKYLTLHHFKTPEDLRNWAVDNKVTIVGVDNVEGSIELRNADLPKDCVLVFGQEGPGLSADMRSICEQLIAIEQYGSTRSINVAAAAAIVMYEWVRRNTV